MSATRAKIALSLLLAIWAYAFWPSIKGIVEIYCHSGYDYQGFIIIPLALLLIWYKRAALHRIATSFSPLGLLLLLLFATSWLFAVIAKLELLEQVSLISMLLAIIFMVLGKKISLILYLPFLSLFLLLPIGQHVYNHLQQVFSWLLVETISVTRLAVYWENNHIHIGNKIYVISEILIGLKYIMLYLSLGMAYAFMQTRKWYEGIFITANFIVLPFAFIFISLFMFININRWFEIQTLTIVHYSNISWILTILGLISATVIGYYIGRNGSNKTAFNDIDWRSNSASIGWIAIAIASTILIATPILAHKLQTNLHYANNSVLLNEPGKINNWQGPMVMKISTNKNKFIEYTQNKKPLVLSLAHNNGHNNQINLYDPQKWQPIKQSLQQVSVNNINIPVTEVVLKSKNQSKIVWNIYYTNGHLSNNQLVNKALESLYSLSKDGAETGTISLSTDVSNELGAGRALLKDFLVDLNNSKTSPWLS